MVDNIICTNRFKKSVQKLIAKNKTFGKELLDTIDHLQNLDFTRKNDLKHHNVKGKLAGYSDIHFSKTNNDLILIYKFRSDGTLFILEIQDVTDHKGLRQMIPTKNLVPYNREEIFADILKESIDYETQNRLIETYSDLYNKCKRLEGTDYEDGYCDAIYDMIVAFGLQNYFNVE